MADKKESFVFYRSYIEAVEKLPENRRYAFIHAIANYALDGVLPTFDGAEDIAFTLMKANIDSCNRRYNANVSNGKKGGRPPKNSSSKKPNKNPTITQAKPKQNLNENDNDNVNETNYHCHDNNALSEKKAYGLFSPAQTEEKPKQRKYEEYTTETGEIRFREVI